MIKNKIKKTINYYKNEELLNGNFNRFEIKKSNILLNAKSDLDLRENKIILYLISKIRYEDEDFKLETLRKSDIQKILGKSINYDKSFTEKLINNLSKSTVSIPTEETIKVKPLYHREYSTTKWFEIVRWNSKEKVFELKLNSTLKHYLLKLGVGNGYRSYNYGYIQKLKCKYTIKIYELLLLRHKSNPKRVFSFDELCFILHVPLSSMQIGEFKRNVLNKVQMDIKKNCDIYFEYEILEESKKEYKINFFIKENDLAIKKENKIEKDYSDRNLESFIGLVLTNTNPENKDFEILGKIISVEEVKNVKNKCEIVVKTDLNYLKTFKNKDLLKNYTYTHGKLKALKKCDLQFDASPTFSNFDDNCLVDEEYQNFLDFENYHWKPIQYRVFKLIQLDELKCESISFRTYYTDLDALHEYENQETFENINETLSEVYSNNTYGNNYTEDENYEKYFENMILNYNFDISEKEIQIDIL